MLTPGRKVMTNLDSILKSKDINLPTKVHLVKTMVFPVVMYETSRQSWMLGAGALGRPRGRVGKGGGRRVQDGECGYTCGGFLP